MMLQNRRILVGITGGIAAYKVCELISTLAKEGALVRAIMTEGAKKFIPPLTVTTLCRHHAYTDEDFWQPTHARPLHIDLGEWAEVLTLAPMTANTLAKLAHGMADNLLTNTVLASTCPILLAPAMNTDMWQQRTVQQNWQHLMQDQRYHRVGPGTGILACDRVGDGRMAEPQEIKATLESLLYTGGKRDLAGKRVLISAGGTREYLDPVRFISNPSSGKMGIALAQAAMDRGASVTLVHGPIDSRLMSSVYGIQSISVTSAAQMQDAMFKLFPAADITVMAAAVADIRPRECSAEKLPKSALPESLPLESVPDIVAQLGDRKHPHQTLVGFAAQTGDIMTPALDKLKRKKLDAIVANPIDQPDTGIGSDRNQGVFLHKSGSQKSIPPCSKLALAHQLFDWLMAKSQTTSAF